jgi:hypothetical protein
MEKRINLFKGFRFLGFWVRVLIYVQQFFVWKIFWPEPQNRIIGKLEPVWNFELVEALGFHAVQNVGALDVNASVIPQNPIESFPKF